MANPTLTDLEIEANELVLSIDTLRCGHGVRAFETLQRGLASGIRSELLRQFSKGHDYTDRLDALIAGGMPEADAIAQMAPVGAELDAFILASEQRMIPMWRKVVSDLMALGKEALDSTEAA